MAQETWVAENNKIPRMKANTKLSEILSLVCIPIHEHPFHYEVASRKNPGTTHRVILRDQHGQGTCECQNYLFTCQPKLNKGAEPFQIDTACIHLAAAAWHDQVRRLTQRKP